MASYQSKSSSKTFWAWCLSCLQMCGLVVRQARAANLGLRHPTEQALALILACALNMDAQIRESEKFALLTKHKDWIKRLLQKPDPPVYLLLLPSTLEDLPSELKLRAFPDGSLPVKHEKAAALLVSAKA